MKRKNISHIRPKSRGGDSSPKNITLLCVDCHTEYHKNFSNMTPDEVIAFLVKYYWNDQWLWVHLAMKKHEHEVRLLQA
jgi:hypothetical protein